jgi:ubiquinone/menaquinone biosynthesis C-methylase UbiE
MNQRSQMLIAANPLNCYNPANSKYKSPGGTSLNQNMLTYYNDSGDKEWLRLESMWAEFLVNSTFIKRYLKPNSRILDIGAGPGRYSIALAQDGHNVWIADRAVSLIAQAKERVSEAGVKDRILGFNVLDARDLSLFPDSSFDAILAMGPFYHLQDSADRVLAAREISRVLRPGGHAFLAFIPRTYIIAQCLATPDYFRSIAAPDKLAEFWKTGCYDSIESGRWTGAYCGKIGEMRNLFLESGLEQCQLISSESVTMLMDMETLASTGQVSGPERDQIEKLLIEASAEPEMAGLSIHVLFIGKRRDSANQRQS